MKGKDMTRKKRGEIRKDSHVYIFIKQHMGPVQTLVKIVNVDIPLGYIREYLQMLNGL